MQKEPMNSPILPENKRRKRKLQSTYAMSNISYQSLYELYSREYRIKGLPERLVDICMPQDISLILQGMTLCVVI